MKILLVISVLAAAVLAKTGCVCPDFVHSEANGMSVNGAATTDTALPPCCEDLARQNAALQQSRLRTDKHTPGSPCSSLTSCESCTVLAFCRWHRIPLSKDSVHGCVDETAVDQEAALEYVSNCKSRDGILYGLAEERDFKEMKDAPFMTVPHANLPASQNLAPEPDLLATGNLKMTTTTVNTPTLEQPFIAMSEEQWPKKFDGLLPPAGCDHVDKSKYPSGLPGCGDYVNEGTSLDAGHMTTDIVSDPRLPVETHVPNYPLGANSQLPDHLVQGGDWSLPQPNAPWIKPDFNKNGCLGGPCDEMTQHACTGLACSHVVVHGEKHHDSVKGSVYARENGGEHLKKEDHKVHKNRSEKASS